MANERVNIKYPNKVHRTTKKVKYSLVKPFLLKNILTKTVKHFSKYVILNTISLKQIFMHYICPSAYLTWI